MRLTCRRNRFRLAADSLLNNDHVSGCLRCQAEAAKYRSMLRQLSQMQTELVPAPAGLPENVARGLSRVADLPKQSRAREMALATAGVAAMAGAVTIWRRRVSA